MVAAATDGQDKPNSAQLAGQNYMYVLCMQPRVSCAAGQLRAASGRRKWLNRAIITGLMICQSRGYREGNEHAVDTTWFSERNKPL